MGAEEWPEDPAGIFGKNLRLLREARKLSQDRIVQEMKERGHSWYQSTVYRIEQGKQEATYSESRDLAAILQTSMERFSWTGPEANTAAYVYDAGSRLKPNYDRVAEAVERLLGDWAGAERTLERFKDSEYGRVRQACADVAARMEDYTLDYAIQLGEYRFYNRGKEEEGGDEGAEDQEGEPGVVDQRGT